MGLWIVLWFTERQYLAFMDVCFTSRKWKGGEAELILVQQCSSVAPGMSSGTALLVLMVTSVKLELV